MPRHVLGGAEEQETGFVQRVMKQRDQAVLKLGREIDQKVPAGDQVELREGRVPQQVVHREQADLAQVAGDAIGASSRTK